MVDGPCYACRLHATLTRSTLLPQKVTPDSAEGWGLLKFLNQPVFSIFLRALSSDFYSGQKRKGKQWQIES